MTTYESISLLIQLSSVFVVILSIFVSIVIFLLKRK